MMYFILHTAQYVRERQSYSRVRDDALYSLRRLDNGQRIGERGQRMKRFVSIDDTD